MIAYKKEWLNNLLVRRQADKAYLYQCISLKEKEEVYAARPVGFYTPNFFIRIGLFILTVIIVLFGFGLGSLVFLSVGNENVIGGALVAFAGVVYGGLELMVSNRHYKSGVDDALVWLSAACLIGGLNIMINLSFLANAVIVCLVAVFFFLRFTATVMAAVAGLALLAIVFFALIQLGAMAKAVAPFVLMLAAAVLYIAANRCSKTEKWKFYNSGLLLLSAVALVCIYVGGNYLVVREASVAMFNLHLKEGENIPFSWLFWIFTVVIPILYIVTGVRKKDIVLMRIGLLLVGALVFTIRYYYHVLPAELAMVLGGLLLIGIAYALIRYLHTPKYGFTYQEQQDGFMMDKLQVESLVIAQTFSGPQLPPDTGPQFGGGTGSGGGASGGF